MAWGYSALLVATASLELQSLLSVRSALGAQQLVSALPYAAARALPDTLVMLQIGPVKQKRATPAPQAAWFPSRGLPRAIPVRLGATLRRLALQSVHSVPPVPIVTLLGRPRTLPVSAVL